MSDKFLSEDEAISSSYERTVVVGDKSKKLPGIAPLLHPVCSLPLVPAQAGFTKLLKLCYSHGPSSAAPLQAVVVRNAALTGR